MLLRGVQVSKRGLLHCQSERKPQGSSGKGTGVQLTAMLGVPPSLGFPSPPVAFPPPYCDLGQETREVLDFMGSVPHGLPLGQKEAHPNKLLRGDEAGGGRARPFSCLEYVPRAIQKHYAHQPFQDRPYGKCFPTWARKGLTVFVH